VLGKYLVSFSRAQYITNENENTRVSSGTTYRRRLHILYLLHDSLHHTKYHASNSTAFSTLSGSIQPYLVNLIQLASGGSRAKLAARIRDLLQLWEDDDYFHRDYVDKLREAAASSANNDFKEPVTKHGASTGRASEVKEQPYVMPASHGDPFTPYYDLPAGNMMPHIMPNRPVPIRPDDIRALQFVAGPADESLVTAVKEFMKAVERIDNGGFGLEDEGIVEDIDELGQISLRDEPGEVVAGQSYYGWSRDFCDKMKSRGEKKGGMPGRNRSYSSSGSRTRSPRKRRRYSDSTSSRSRSYSYSRSQSRHRPHNHSRNHDGDLGANGKNRPRSRSRSYSPIFEPPSIPSDTAPASTVMYQANPRDPRLAGYPDTPGVPPSSFISPPTRAGNHYAFPPPLLSPDGLPMPPSRPPNYSGLWPPPPPASLPNPAFNGPHGMQPSPSPPGFPQPYRHYGGHQSYGKPAPNKWQR
jgi:CID domain